MKKVNKKKGFTLAELLVVIAILAILVAIAVPVFTGVLSDAEQTVQDANLHAAQSAAMVDYLTSEATEVVAARKAGSPFKYTYTVDENTKNVDLTAVGVAQPADKSEANSKEAGTVVVRMD